MRVLHYEHQPMDEDIEHLYDKITRQNLFRCGGAMPTLIKRALEQLRFGTQY
jgi:hypothetical protein